MAGGSNTRALGSRSSVWAQLGIVGLPLVSVGLLVNLSIRRLFVTNGLGSVPLFGVPAVDIRLPLVPFGTTEFDFGVWLATWMEGLLHAGLLTGYYFSWASVFVGVVFSFVALVGGKQPQHLLGGFVLLARDRRVHYYLAFQTLFWLVSFNPWLVSLAIEFGTALTAAGSVFLIAGTVLFAVADRCGPVATVVVVHPLGAVTFVLPPIAAALVSPAVRTGFRALTTELTIWLLLNVFEPLGVSRLLQRQFDLEGVGFFLLWTAVVVVLGWSVGVVRYVREQEESGLGGLIGPLR